MGSPTRSLTEITYDYEFRLWPDEHTWEHPLYEVFRMYPRVILTISEAEFHRFRDSLERSGFTLRETSRTPHHEPETVI